MSRMYYFFSQLNESEMELVLFHHRKEFDELLNDQFSEGELKGHEKVLESMAAVSVSEMLPELTFDDFYASEQHASEQRAFFERCQSCLCLEHVPFLETNPFQVSYFERLLSRIDQVLIDQGGVEEVLFKAEFLAYLKPLKRMEDLVRVIKPKAVAKGPSDIVDFHVLAVYQELNRLQAQHKLSDAQSILLTKSERMQKIWQVMQRPGLEAQQIQAQTGIIPKDFGDLMESLKFTLKKI